MLYLNQWNLIFQAYIKLIILKTFQMGAVLGVNSQNIDAQKQRFTTTFSVSNNEQLKKLLAVINKRSNFNSQYVCGVKGYQVISDHQGICQDRTQILVFIDRFDHLLHPLKHRFKEQEVFYFIHCIANGLHFFVKNGYNHGDISGNSIGRVGIKWKIIDTYFLRAGISGYERVLEGQKAFLSPQQMSFLKQGYINESPKLKESDDVFALGMIVLEIMTGMNSHDCYKQSYIRFSTDIMDKRLGFCRLNYSDYLNKLLGRMLALQEKNRISLREIISQPFILKYGSDKISMK